MSAAPAPWTALGCLALAAGVTALLPEGGPLRAGLGLFALIGSLWLTQALPLSFTALLVPLLAVLAGVLTVREALAAFAQPVIFLFLGGFALAAALSRQRLDHALALALLRLARGRTALAVLGLFGLTAVLSMWLSNTATAAMMLPLALGLLPDPQRGPPEALSARRTRAFVLLGLAYSASIGGMGTLVGSPPNAIAAAQAGIGFAQWLAIGLPLVAVLWPLMVGLLYLLLRPRFASAGAETPRPDTEAPEPWTWTRERVLTLAIFGLTVTGWVAGAPLARALGLQADIDTLVALAAIALLGASGVLRWDDLERQTQWGVLLLFGGGLTLSQVMSVTGGSDFLAQGLMAWVAGAPTWLVLLALVAFVVMLTELVSNTASAALIVPIALGMAPAWGLSPVAVAAAVAMSASCAFMLPVATPPNAIVYGSGGVSPRTMMRAGLGLNLLAIAVITAVAPHWR
ncbi:DASS family sodium-coupled anion symporter [Aquabacterium sp. A08]|uniref:SLC13 family permease n=1 Tax=Aquabacterium sp. A08 TaxID=2718532 RepID=UPI0014240A77|nr:DASS family sodium-coupled anion symporter [Aquabacterium sp. A08]NIC40197.1 SLC13/DASS family transporter [Aquabacterium sp. A08]